MARQRQIVMVRGVGGGRAGTRRPSRNINIDHIPLKRVASYGQNQARNNSTMVKEVLSSTSGKELSGTIQTSSLRSYGQQNRTKNYDAPVYRRRTSKV